MSRFFIDRPIVSMVISILMTLLGVVSLAGLPIAQFPDIAPPEIQLTATYVGADALTVEEAVSTPIEQQMSGVDGMLYMYSTNASNGIGTLRVNFEVGTDANTDQILTQMRYQQAESQLPTQVKELGVTIKKSTTSPLALFSVYSPNETYDAEFLANYAYININDPMTRVSGVGQVNIFGSGQYAMRFWVEPDKLAQMKITIPEIMDALQQQNAVNPAGQIGAEPIPAGQQFTYTVRAQGRLKTPEEFGDVIIRANPDGSLVTLKDVARIQLGAQNYSVIGRLDGKPAAIVAIYQDPGSNAIDTMDQATALMEQLKTRFPADLDYKISLDTTQAVREGMKEIVITLVEALALVIFVVFIFLQGWRATLIPLLAVPVALVGTFAIFPLLGFTINTLSLLGLVLAIGIVVDDAIVVVEAVEKNIEGGLEPRDATLKAMSEVTAPIVGTTLILIAVFVPTAFIPGITGRLYQQFAVTIAVSVLISSFNALTLSPALSAMLLRPRKPMRGPAGRFFAWFNKTFDRATDGYVSWSEFLIHKAKFAMLFLAILGGIGLFLGSRLPTGFVPEEDQGYLFANIQLPDAASMERTDEVSQLVEKILAETDGIEGYNTIVGFSMLSQVNTTYSAFLFITLEPWDVRDPKGLEAKVIARKLNQQFARKIPEAKVVSFSPPAIPGIGTSGGVTFVLEDIAGGSVEELAANTDKFIKELEKRPEFFRVSTTFIPDTPQYFARVDRDKVLKQGVALKDVYQTLQAFMGGSFVNYFNRFGRTWQVYLQAEGEYRTKPSDISNFYVRNSNAEMVPLETFVTMERSFGPEFTLRFNGHRAAQINGMLWPWYSSGQGMAAFEEVFEQSMPPTMGYGYMGMSYQEKVAAEGVSPVVVFGLSLLAVFLILAALYESWALPISVLLATPIAIFGAFVGLLARMLVNDVYAQIGLVLLVGMSAKNAILIVEFARDKLAAGETVEKAALDGARLRLRPIMMTAFSFILGVMPLVLATGSGAEARHILGTAVMSGMLASSLIGIFLVPVSFYVVESWRERREARNQGLPSSGGEAKP
ncbi:MAG: multidrug efflux RND transporter permease subunit [Candidatus Binatia bacterium]|nr:multidrug efflux RND transporter permease subunit [Candidatus Binatia bacterium]MDG2008759.1 multidrug efflux RND transporter permease subunit [Candidatus Binatia bacterium]